MKAAAALADRIAAVPAYTARDLGAERFMKYGKRPRAKKVFLVAEKERKLVIKALRKLAK